nr:TnsA-like heteromeric transposase endonuclease subunit [Mycobacterium sp.]
MGRSADKASTASVSFRCADDLSEVTRGWTAAGIDELAAGAPWRTFRWYRGQRHYSGTYWSSTVGRHVIYESQLELARLLFADFDARVRSINAQPFLFRTSVDRKPRKHIPDYLWIRLFREVRGSWCGRVEL